MHVERFALTLLLAAGVAGCSQGNKETPTPAAVAAPEPMPTPAPVPAAKEPAPTPAPATAPAKPGPAPVPAAKVPDGDRAAALIAGLGDKEYAAREKAGQDLAAMGLKVLPLLEEATKNPDAEISQRAVDLIVRIKGAEEEAGVPDFPELAGNMRKNLAQNTLSPGASCSCGDRKGNSVTVGMVAGGVVKLTIAPRGAGAKVFTAPSLRDFETKYPKLYAKYLDPLPAAPKPEPAPPPAAKPRPAPAAPAKAPEARPVDPEQVARLIKGLGDADAASREKAAAELAKLGEPVLPALKRAAAGSDDAAKLAAELAFRVEDAAAPKIASLTQIAKGMGKHGGHTPSTGGGFGDGHDGFNCGDGQGNKLSVSYSGDGSVSVQVRAKNGEEKSYSAPSLDEFKKRYPGVFKAYLAD